MISTTRNVAVLALPALFVAFLGCGLPAVAEAAVEAPVAKKARATHPRDLSFTPMEFEIPKTERRVLGNGLVLHLLENHELPIVTLTAWIRVGQTQDPADKIGLGALTGICMRAGGTHEHPSDELDEELDRIAAIIATSIAEEHGTANLSVLTRNLDAGLRLFAEVLRTPAFPDQTLGLYKQQLLAGYRTRNDDPGAIADREFLKILYGDHPYAHEATPATIGAIGRQDLVDLHAKTFRPENVVLGIAGDFETDAMVKKVEALLGNWERGGGALPVPPAVDDAPKPGVYHVEKDLTQSSIRIGHLGVKRNTEERVKADLMNIILGGGSFGSRLNGAVRARGGLAYTIYSQFTRSVDLGQFKVVTDTKSGSTWKAIGLILDEIRRIRDEPVTADELQGAKDMILNGMVFGWEDPADVVDAYVSLEYYGYPENWYERYLGIVRSMTVEEIREAARRRLDPENLTILIVGKEASLDERPEGLPEPEPLSID